MGVSLILCTVKDGVPDFVESDTLPATAVENIRVHPITAHVEELPESVTQMKVLERWSLIVLFGKPLKIAPLVFSPIASLEPVLLMIVK